MNPLHLLTTALVLCPVLLGAADREEAETPIRYRVLSVAQMDMVGFNAIANDEGLVPDAKGVIRLKDLPPEKIATSAMMRRTLEEIEKGGWKLTAVNPDYQFIFRNHPLPLPAWHYRILLRGKAIDDTEADDWNLAALTPKGISIYRSGIEDTAPENRIVNADDLTADMLENLGQDGWKLTTNLPDRRFLLQKTDAAIFTYRIVENREIKKIGIATLPETEDPDLDDDDQIAAFLASQSKNARQNIIREALQKLGQDGWALSTVDEMSRYFLFRKKPGN